VGITGHVFLNGDLKFSNVEDFELQKKEGKLKIPNKFLQNFDVNEGC